MSREIEILAKQDAAIEAGLRSQLSAQARLIEQKDAALRHCLLEHGGFWLAGESERLVREALALSPSSQGDAVVVPKWMSDTQRAAISAEYPDVACENLDFRERDKLILKGYIRRTRPFDRYWSTELTVRGQKLRALLGQGGGR